MRPAVVTAPIHKTAVPINHRDGHTPLVNALERFEFDVAAGIVADLLVAERRITPSLTTSCGISEDGVGDEISKDNAEEDEHQSDNNNNSYSAAEYLNTISYTGKTALTAAIVSGAPISFIKELLALGADATLATREIGSMVSHATNYGVERTSVLVIIQPEKNLPPTFRRVTCPTQQCYHGHPMTTGNYGDTGVPWRCNECPVQCTSSREVALQCRICAYCRCMGCVAYKSDIRFEGQRLQYEAAASTTTTTSSHPNAPRVCQKCREPSDRRGFETANDTRSFVCISCALDLYNEAISTSSKNTIITEASSVSPTAPAPPSFIRGRNKRHTSYTMMACALMDIANIYQPRDPPVDAECEAIVAIARMLLAAGASPTHPDMAGFAPIHHAIATNNLPLVRLLVEEFGVMIEPLRVAADGSWGYDLEDTNANNDPNTDIIDTSPAILVADNNDELLWWNPLGIRQMPLLWYAVVCGDVTIAAYLIDRCGADVTGGVFAAGKGDVDGLVELAISLWGDCSLPTEQIIALVKVLCDRGAAVSANHILKILTQLEDWEEEERAGLLQVVLDCGGDVAELLPEMMKGGGGVDGNEDDWGDDISDGSTSSFQGEEGEVNGGSHPRYVTEEPVGITCQQLLLEAGVRTASLWAS